MIADFFSALNLLAICLGYFSILLGLGLLAFYVYHLHLERKEKAEETSEFESRNKVRIVKQPKLYDQEKDIL